MNVITSGMASLLIYSHSLYITLYISGFTLVMLCGALHSYLSLAASLWSFSRVWILKVLLASGPWRHSGNVERITCSSGVGRLSLSHLPFDPRLHYESWGFKNVFIIWRRLAFLFLFFCYFCFNNFFTGFLWFRFLYWSLSWRMESSWFLAEVTV